MSESSDSGGVVSESFINVSWVSDIFGSLLLGGELISLKKNFFSSGDVFLEHFTEENVVDLNIMCRESVVEEVGWEHHVVSVEPEVSAILIVESILISLVLESASSDNHCGAPEVAE